VIYTDEGMLTATGERCFNQWTTEWRGWFSYSKTRLYHPDPLGFSHISGAYL